MKTLLKNSKRNRVTKRAHAPAPLNKKRWQQRLAFPEPDERGKSFYVRPYQCDEKIIRELSDFTGESYNTVVIKLIHVALNNKPLTTEVFERHVQSLDKVENYFENALLVQQTVSNQLAAIKKQQARSHRFLLVILSEIYCLLHIGVSLVRALFTTILGSQPNVEMTIEKMLADFDDVDDRVIKKSFRDYNSTLQFYRLTGENINPYQLFLRAKLGDNNWIKRRAEWYEQERDANSGTDKKPLSRAANKAPNEAPNAQEFGARRDRESSVGATDDNDLPKTPQQPQQDARQFGVAESNEVRGRQENTLLVGGAADEAGDEDNDFDEGDGYDDSADEYEFDDEDELGDEFIDEDEDEDEYEEDDDSENDEG